MSRFPTDCWDKKCEYFSVRDLNIDDLICSCDLLRKECDACDEDYCFLMCPKDKEAQKA